jgi:membrane protease YdiL (CAAX protease family)
MGQGASPVADMRVAGALSGAAGVMAALALPALLGSFPPEARELPLPVPVFSAALALQIFVVYGLLGWVGMRMARSKGVDPSPRREGLLRAVAAGLACGVGLVAVVAVISRVAPGTLPRVMHPPTPVAALLLSVTGSIGEEILFRLFVLGGALMLLPEGPGGRRAAIGVSAIAFAVMHAPGWVFLFGGDVASVPALSWAWLIGLNGAVGVVYGALYVRYGIGAAIVAHLATNLVWHVGSSALA